MKSNSSSGFNLKNSFSIHAIIIGFSIVLVGIIAAIQGMKFFSDEFLFLLTLILIELELFIWLGKAMFQLKMGTSPKEITRKIVFRFIQYYLICMVIAALIYLALTSLLYLKNHEPLSHLLPNLLKWEFKKWLFSTNIGLTFGAFVFFLIQWQDALKREQRLREEKLAFQYETLNNQVNPHFLFNSLNTLSSFISSRPDIAEEYVTRLSSIYRYIIDNGSKNQISLDSEIQFIQDYFYLHKLRDNDKISLIIDVPHGENYKIIPVSLQILIENALKHNMASKSNPLLIQVYLEGTNVVVKNNLQKMSTLETSLKKGLKNLNERIYLSTGKTTEIIEDRKEYIVKVPLLS